MKATAVTQDLPASGALERQPSSLPDRPGIAGTFAIAAERLDQAVASLRELSEILRNPVATLCADEQQVAAAIPLAKGRDIMNSPIAARGRELLAANDIAMMLAIDSRSFRRLRNNRSEKFPKPISIGRSKRWRVREVQEWLDSRRSG